MNLDIELVLAIKNHQLTIVVGFWMPPETHTEEVK